MSVVLFLNPILMMEVSYKKEIRMEQDDITPDLYNPEFVEEDGDYNTLLGGIFSISRI